MARYWVISNLQKKLHLAPATLTGLVDGLADSWLIRRWRDDSDQQLDIKTLNTELHDILSQLNS
jgi:DNA-binding MarR family transcriptional regulator